MSITLNLKLVSLLLLSIIPSFDKAENEGFNIFINQFPEVSLPIQFHGQIIESETSVKLDPKISENFIKGSQYHYVYGKIPSNDKFVGVITLGVANTLLPFLHTFSLNGELVSSEQISMGTCGAGMCVSCIEVTEISSNLDIYFADSLTVYDCNDDGEEVSNKKDKYVTYVEGNVLDDGYILLLEEKKNKL
ncbi:hypothetical protein KMW28_24395 [Flammeovirga yaeyamensis]|uniref:Uncharacterized protein n=1 Tax=Flammeovirga yaeyamensis TaxID=367791 RepID=A0AAX1N938_9BACT|nr:hypothetical protein [Flammeovirga yaeyamensis]MBB3699574.1 hypothetical protein [Flammeovirga yaeyamensis]NMF35171.1 hypothetical protein [Flammeovirga yaeyamensis]QWG04035.1 hypothetical protein KMW28_24395 [Flammeovirga yaeyamensis]